METNISSNNQTTYTVKKLSSGTKPKAQYLLRPNRKLDIDMFCEDVRMTLVANTDNTFDESDNYK